MSDEKKYLSCLNCGGWINTDSTAYDIIKTGDGRTVYTHMHHCTHQAFVFGNLVGRVIQTKHPVVEEFK